MNDKGVQRLRSKRGRSGLFLLVALGTMSVTSGCGAVLRTGLASAGLSPSTTAVQVGGEVRFSTRNRAIEGTCTWQSSEPDTLVSLGSGIFQAKAQGSATVVVDCGSEVVSSAAVHVIKTPSGPITITKGGSYTGIWTSDDPKTPAVHILTDQPVTLHDAVITGRGDLIDIDGTGEGVNVKVENVTGRALDPGVAGMQRGSFVSAQHVASLRVEHCSMVGVSFGVKVLSSTPSALVISKNRADQLEDRASDGKGGLLATRPNLGHFVYLYQVVAPHGAEIGWNEMVNTIGESSVEDVINVYKSQGTPAAPIRVFNNYLEGYSSTTTASYTGTGVIADGDGNAPVTAFLNVNGNVMVHVAGSGIEVAAGNHILVRRNHVVSCGMNPQGSWFAMPFVNAVVVWNYYGAPQFGDITVEHTKGGMVRPGADGTPVPADLWARATDLDATDSVNNNDFTDPCFENGHLNLGAEDAERARWAAKLALAGIEPGDTHIP